MRLFHITSGQTISGYAILPGYVVTVRFEICFAANHVLRLP